MFFLKTSRFLIILMFCQVGMLAKLFVTKDYEIDFSSFKKYPHEF
jgi:hypothetical protein